MIRENEYFWLQSGQPIRSLKELKDVLPKLSPEEFSFHVNQSKNDFAVWVRDVFDRDLAQLLAQSQSQEEIIEVMNEEFENEEEEDSKKSEQKTSDEQSAQETEQETTLSNNSEKKQDPQTGKIADSLPQTFEEILEKKQSGPEDGEEYSGDEGMSYREKLADRFAEAHKKMLDSLKHVVPETLQQKFEFLEEKEKELRMEISEQRKKGFDLYIADITLQKFRPLLDMAKATEDTNDIKVIEKLFEEVQQEIEYAKEHPSPNVKKEIEALSKENTTTQSSKNENEVAE